MHPVCKAAIKLRGQKPCKRSGRTWNCQRLVSRSVINKKHVSTINAPVKRLALYDVFNENCRPWCTPVCKAAIKLRGQEPCKRLGRQLYPLPWLNDQSASQVELWLDGHDLVTLHLHLQTLQRHTGNTHRTQISTQTFFLHWLASTEEGASQRHWTILLLGNLL